MIPAILKAQWLSVRRGSIGGSRLGRAAGFAAVLVWYSIWTVLGVAAYRFASVAEPGGPLVTALPRGLMFVVLYWQFAPVLTAGMGASLDTRRLRLYPVPESRLFFIEVLLRLTTGVEMLLVFAGLLLGLSANPRFSGPGPAFDRLALYALFAAFNLLLAVGIRSVLERLLSRKVLREVLALLLVCAAVLPQLLLMSGKSPHLLRHAFFTAPWPGWPWSATARLALPGWHWTDWAVLIAWTLLAWRFARWQFARSLRYDFEQAGATPRTAAVAPTWRDRLYRIPPALLPQALGTMVEKELRTLIRAPRFRTVFIMGFSFGLIVWLPLALGPSGNSAIAGNFLVLVSLYALALLGQVSYWNAFGFDRGAAQAYFMWPVGIRTVLAGKNIAAGIYILLEMLAVTAASLVARIPLSAGKIVEAYLVTPVAALYLLAAGNLSSVHVPRPMAPEKVAQGGGAGRFQGLMFLIYPAALVPVALAYLARYAFRSEAAFYVTLAFAAAGGVVVYWTAMESAAAAAERKREQFLCELSRGEGPVSMN